MRTVLILSGFLVVALLLARLIRQQRETDDDMPPSAWDLLRGLVVPLLAGLLLLGLTVRGLATGMVECSAKGACSTPVFLRAEHPQAYWTNLGLLAVGSALLLWLAWGSYKRWRSSSRGTG